MKVAVLVAEQKLLLSDGRVESIKTDTDTYVEGLREAGIHVVVVTPTKDNYLDIEKGETFDNIDVIWAPYEKEIPAALYLRNKYKVPLVGHYEWASPFRTAIDDPKRWGFSDEEIAFMKTKKDLWVNDYRISAQVFDLCDIKTVPSVYCLSTIKGIYPELKEKNFYFKPYIIDDKAILENKEENVEKKHQIITISRIVSHKRIGHMIKALAKVKNPPLLKVVGYGPDVKYLIPLLKETRVFCEFMGKMSKPQFVRHIQESKFALHLCASLPIGECGLLKVPSICYTNENMVEKHGNIGRFIEENNIDELAKAIQDWVDHPDKVTEQSEKDYEILTNGKTGLMPSEFAVAQLINIFKEAKKVKVK